MAEVVLATASQKQVWQKAYFQEYVRESMFMPYMSNADKNKGGIILTKFEELQEGGKTINVPFIGRLKGTGVTGSQTLDGNEEALTNYNMPISVDWRRNGVRVPKSESYKTEIDLLDASKDALRTWEAEKFRDDIISAFASFVSDTAGATVTAAASTSTDRNAWAAANSDRILAGVAVSNYSATWATMLGNLDTTNDKCTAASMSLAKRIAKNADPHIRPFKTKDGYEYYVAFHGSRTFRDLKADSTIIAANRDARARENGGMNSNPLFQDGDLLYDGIIHREVPEIDAFCLNSAGGIFTATGASSADVRPVFLAGGGAVAVAWGQMPTPRTDFVKDYGFRPGVAIEELLGVKKINFNGVQNGLVTCLFAAAADS
jgi:hypothetical protein